MDKSDINQRLTDIFRNVFDNPDIVIKDTMNSNDIENWDSLSHFLLISNIEEKFNIKLGLSELNKTTNVGDLLELIHSKI